MNKDTASILVTLAGVVIAVALLTTWRSQRPQHTPPPPSTRSTFANPSQPELSAPTPLAGNRVSRSLSAALALMRSRTDVRKGEAILTFRDDAALARFLARADLLGLEVLERLDSLRSVRTRYRDIATLEKDALQNASDYEDLSGNYLVNVPRIPAAEARTARNQIPFGNNALNFIGATGDRSQWGRGVTIAVLDTGVAGDPTFGAGRLSALDIGFGTAPGGGTEDGHGTSVAALAGGLSPDAPGVAPAANILSIRVTDENGISDIFALSRAIIAAVDAGARIVNVSMGGYGTHGVLNSAIAYAQSRDAVIVAAAGNDQAAQLTWPAADARVISVGAVDRGEQQVIFSNSGPQLQLSAPGYGVQTAWLNGQRALVDGTSASTPLVSGAIAALMSEKPGLSAQQAAQSLTRFASDAGAPGADPEYGSGILNLRWAMNATNPAYLDTAVSSHHYNAAEKQMEFVVQNRSGQTVSGLTLSVSSGGASSTHPVSSLIPGESQVVSVPMSAAAASGGGTVFTTTLINPAGLNDQVPANNRRSSVLTAIPKP